MIEDIVDKVLSYYKGDLAHLEPEEDTMRERIDRADQLLRQHNYDKKIVAGQLVQKYLCSIQEARSYMRYAEIIHAAFMEINIDYEMLWLYNELKKRIQAADPKDKNYSKLIHAGRELLLDIEKKKAKQGQAHRAVNITIVHDPKLLGIPEDFNEEEERVKINELRRKVKRQLNGGIEDIEFEDVK